MSSTGVVVLAAVAGLNPWLTLLIVAGLATFTRHVPLAAPVAAWLSVEVLVGLALLLGAEAVASKTPQSRHMTERINLAAAGGAGALLCVAIPAGLATFGPFAPLLGAALGLCSRLVRNRLARPVERLLRPYGHIGMGIACNVATGASTAAIVALHAA